MRGTVRGKESCRIAQTAVLSGGWKPQGANHGQASAVHRDNRGAELQGTFQTRPSCLIVAAGPDARG